MPCKPGNSPTERIGELLIEFEDLEQYCDALLQLIPDHLMEKVPPKPIAVSLLKEQTRRQLTLSTVEKNKMAKRRSRQRLESGHRLKGRGDFSDDAGISEAVKKQLEELIGGDNEE